MLSIGKLGRGQESYYLGAVAKGIEDYYTGEGEVDGEWMGTGAARLGLSGTVEGGDLRAVLGGNDPRDGRRLAGRTRSDRVPGWDLTFSAPKSVSVLYALGGDDVAREVVAAHREAVRSGLLYLERHATVSRRRVDGVVERVRGEGLVAAAFRHRTSRAGDPQLHTHCLAANLVELADGGWGALYSPVVYRHARTAGFVYQAVLRSELTDRLGVAWEDVHSGYAEIDGIDPRLLALFSTRRHEIEAAMAERGETSMSAARTATLSTRRAKDYGIDPETLADRWVGEAAAIGIEPGSVRSALWGPAPRVRPADLDDIADQMAGPHGLTAEDASFRRSDVMRAWCTHLPPGSRLDLETLEELTDGFVEDKRVVPVLDGSEQLVANQTVRRADGTTTSAAAVKRRWSTVDMLAVEERLLARVSHSRNRSVGQVDTRTCEAYLASRSSLSDEQAEMVRAVCTSGHGVDVVIGRAGTGKTYALAAAASVWRTAGFAPVGVALAARAAAELETTAGIPSTTVAQFLTDCRQQPQMLDNRHVVVVDETGMIDTRRLAQVVAHAEAASAKAVLVGDHHQLPSIEAGGVLRALAARHDVIELTENRRQVDAWERASLAQLRSGTGGRNGTVEVVERYYRRGRLHVGSSPADVRTAMVTDWLAARRAGEQAVMLALRWTDVAELNARARAVLVADGEVAAKGTTVAGRTFAVGDRVVCLHNDRRVGVHNALFGQVVLTSPDGVVVETEDIARGRRVVVPVTYIADGHLDHAYATTIHKSQGATYDRALVLGDERLYRQAGYTALSRGKIRNDVYLVADDDRDLDAELEPHGRAEPDTPAERLVRALDRDGAKRLASDEDAGASTLPGRQQTLADLWEQRDRLAASGGSPRRELAELRRTISRRADLAGRAAEIDRPHHVTNHLGDPPTSLSGRARWRTAAAAIESYTGRWGVSPVTAGTGAGRWPEQQQEHLAEVLEAIRDSAEDPFDLLPEVGAVGID